jgi:rhomboid protease GluP
VLYCATLAKTGKKTWIFEIDPEVLLSFGANYRFRIQCGDEYWRLLSAVFLNGSLLQIVSNALYQFWMALPAEVAWGRLRFMIVYFGSGALGGLLNSPTSYFLTVSSSAALFGVIGAYAMLVVTSWPRIGITVKRQAVLRLMLTPLFFLFLSFLPRTSWVCHLGGLIGGLSIAAIMFASTAFIHGKLWVILIGALVCIAIAVASEYALQATRPESCN